MSQAFNRVAFEAAFNESLEAIRNSEQITKRELRALSRTVLEATHATGDILFVNNLVAVLTPVNKKVANLYFKEFTGFTFDEATMRFTKKSKKRYEQAALSSVEFLADPLNNIWSWAERNVEVEKKDFDLEQVTKAFQTFVKKAMKENLTQKDVLKAVLKAGVEADTIIELMGEMYDFDVNVAE